jgi:deoxyribodipyrimidine photolyase-related protein
MEEFYRSIRKNNSILMENDKPIGGKWNFDHDNRRKWDPKINLPVRIKFHHDVSKIFSEIVNQNISFIGDIDVNNFNWPKNRHESLQLLEHFLNECLCDFGKFQDSMSEDNKYLFHSLISFSLNTKMLHPMEVVRLAEKKLDPDLTNLNSVEGFIRQIIGWREYIRGIYWAKMPGYDESNYLAFTNELPTFFWNAKTDMNCLKKSIQQSLENAYAHHIQRLMILGNFMLLNETNPKYVHEWFLGIYIDAIEWVELPNVIGMSQYADGGLLATKPYVSSGAYINKMGDYCQSCKYNVKTKYDDDSCPFNSLYWNFFINNPDLLNHNPRMGIVKMQIQKMSDQDKKLLANKAMQLKKNINQL